MDEITEVNPNISQISQTPARQLLNRHPNFVIAVEVSNDYVENLTGGDPEKVALLREAIIRGIRLKLGTVNPLTQREIDELQLALYYSRRSHGTDGHHRLGLLAKFATLLDITLEGETTLKGHEPYAR